MSLLASVCFIGTACREPSPAGSSEGSDKAVEQNQSERLSQLEYTRLSAEADRLAEESSWLRVHSMDTGAPGAWASAGFDPAENKIFIDTHDATRFSLDLSRVPVNWSRLVVIRIDGRNSELKKRDRNRYEFERDAHGQWIVAP